MNIRLFILVFLVFNLFGCSRGKPSYALSGKGIEYPSVPRVELPPEENAFTIWTNAMLSAEPPSGDEELRTALLMACSLKTNLVTNTKPVSRSTYRRAVFANTNITKVVERPRLTKVADSPRLVEWLKSQKPVLEQIDKGVVLGKIQYPPMTISNSLDTLQITGFMSLVHLKKVNGRYLAECGDYSNAINQFCDIFKMADMMATGHGTALAFLIRNGIIASDYVYGLEWLSRENAQNASLLRQILSRIPAPAPCVPALVQGYQNEASLFTLQTFKNIAEEKIYYNAIYPKRLYCLLDPDETAALAQAIFTQAATNACRPWIERNSTLIDQLNQRLEHANVPKPVKTALAQSILFATFHANKKDKDTIELWKTLKYSARREPNVFGLLLLKSSMAFTKSVHERSVKLQCELNLLRAAVALMIIKAETGTYPDTLDETVKKGLLPELPIDFFSGKPLLYAPEHLCIWSIGSDGRSNGGESKTDVIFLLP